MQKIALLLILFISFFIITPSIEAKTLPQAAKTTVKQTSTKTTASTGSTINVTPRLRADKKALLVYFSNLQNAKSVSYMLTYNTNIQQEGAMGGINLTGSSRQTQEILFGTCSKNVCRYHTGIKDAKLEISYTNKAGKKYLKKYRIKI